MGKTQVWLADQMGVAGVSVHNWIAKGTISRDNVVKVARLLQLSLDDLSGHTPAAGSHPAQPNGPKHDKEQDAVVVEAEPANHPNTAITGEQQPVQDTELFLVHVSLDELRVLSSYRKRPDYRPMFNKMAKMLADAPVPDDVK